MELISETLREQGFVLAKSQLSSLEDHASSSWLAKRNNRSKDIGVGITYTY